MKSTTARGLGDLNVPTDRKLRPDYVIPMHCTGEPFYEIAKAEMPTKLLRSFTGTRFVFNS
jgi:7,8-dihydropterin-6-yl-methyl-4-(beta-D-ribofuranosyl)aminobenzene 5'-phosphate synthase